MTAAPRLQGMAVVWRFAIATTLVVLASAMAGPVLAVSLQQAGASTAAVGAFAMLPFLVVGLLIPVVPRVLARFGVVRTYRAGCFMQLFGVLLYAGTDHWLPWTVGSIAGGFGAAAPPKPGPKKSEEKRKREEERKKKLRAARERAKEARSEVRAAERAATKAEEELASRREELQRARHALDLAEREVEELQS